MSVFVFLVFFFPVFGVGIDDCAPTSCSKHGPKIQFPFRHKYRQPQYCGYHPGFDLSCYHEKTVLKLPFSVKVVVKDIDYASQTLQVYDPEGCLPQKLIYKYLNLSASPFQFPYYYRIYDHILFNCSAQLAHWSSSVPCLGDSSNQVYAIPIDARGIQSMSSLISCTKLPQISSIPDQIFNVESLRLEWSEPGCGLCETQRKLCRLNNHTRGPQVMCINRPVTEQGQSNTGLIAGASLGSVLFIVIAASLYLLYISIRADKENQVKIENFLEDYRALKPTRFSYADVKKITNEFSEKLGEGGYGIVYKGKLSGEISVAVKVLNHSQGKGEEFINEVGTIGKIHHVNVVRLVGFCADGFKRALVYEFLPNDSLEKFIFQKGPKRNSLCREKLQEIALGIAKGIEYLHQGCDQQILHFDIKPHNIMLDHNFNPKICDFGLAKLCSKEQSAVSMTVARGTMGYIAPEVLSRTFGKVSYKSDVYSYGMLLLEMVGGRKNVDLTVNASQLYFPQWIYNHLNQGEEISVQIEDGDECRILRKLTIVGLLCIQWNPADRPSMKAVVQMLEGDGDNLTMPPNPFPATNATHPIAGIPGRRYHSNLELISEFE